jgi:sugar phosphate isomerase/epimerase
MSILFNTANLVARFSDYRFTLSDWGGQEKKTIEGTDDREFAKICAEIKVCGYDALELWIAHCHPSKVSVEGAKARRKIAADHGLTVHAVACSYTAEHLKMAEALGAKMICGGLWGTDIGSVKSLVKSSGVAYNFENHPEKTPAEVLAKIDGGSEKIGVALDTGWVGSSGEVGAVAFLKTLGPLVRHVHLKDVAAKGGHHTVELGTGIVDIDAVMRQLKAQGYRGDLSWEDEPEDRDPFAIAGKMRQYIAARA